MSTPHNAANKGDIAKTVLMSGDPLRAKFISENYLENPVCFNTVRNMFGYTGTYKGKQVSVMGHGMGMPSIGIYSYELFNFYDVDNIIRIGSAGSYRTDLKLGDLVIAEGACTDSNYVASFDLPGHYAPIADFGLLRKAVEAAEKLGVKYEVGNVVSSDVFYNGLDRVNERWAEMGCICIEMEAAALYMNAAKAKKHALCMVSISDHLFKEEALSAEDRQTSFRNMMEVALELA
ncbi:MAG: purine-nucleoside phosphorylase [Lachnospiraceae bacterium]|jgi:purine-nucleoside phosphorylase|nr:purine-nucleoside phosphorylase [Lachnospiraceae bacterium]